MQADPIQAFMTVPEVIKVKPVRWQILTDTTFVKEYQIDFDGVDSDRLEVFAKLIYISDRCEIRVPRRHPIDGGNRYQKREFCYITGGVTRSDRVTVALVEMLREEGYELQITRTEEAQSHVRRTQA